MKVTHIHRVADDHLEFELEHTHGRAVRSPAGIWQVTMRWGPMWEEADSSSLEHIEEAIERLYARAQDQHYQVNYGAQQLMLVASCPACGKTAELVPATTMFGNVCRNCAHDLDNMSAMPLPEVEVERDPDYYNP